MITIAFRNAKRFNFVKIAITITLLNLSGISNVIISVRTVLFKLDIAIGNQKRSEKQRHNSRQFHKTARFVKQSVGISSPASPSVTFGVSFFCCDPGVLPLHKPRGILSPPGAF